MENQRSRGQKRVQENVENVSEACFEPCRLLRELQELKEEFSGLLACRHQVQKPGSNSANLGQGLRRFPVLQVVEDWNGA